MPNCDRMGAADNTLIALIQGDNGASGEAGPQGTINELRSIQTHDEDEGLLEANIPQIGSRATYGNYPVGWAWAMNTPLRWTKQYGSMLGGIRNGMIMAWPGHVAKPGAVCAQFGHLNRYCADLARSGEAARARPRSMASRRSRWTGKACCPALPACDAAKPRTQYFELGSKIGLYHDGWFLSGDDGRAAWELEGPGGARPTIQWTLYDLTRDFSQVDRSCARANRPASRQ